MRPYQNSESLYYSIGMHVFGILLALFGLPAILPERAEPEPLVMTVEIVPIGEITNLPNANKPITPKKEAPTPPKPKPETPAIKEPPPKPPEPKEEPKPEPEPVPDPDVKKEEIKEEKKPEPKKEEPKKEEKPKEDDLAALLNKLKEESKEQDKNAKDDTTAPENKTRSDKPYDPAVPLSITEKDAIRSQFIKCWRMPAGSRNAHELAVRVRVQLNQDGSVNKAELASDQRGKYSSDTFFRAAADSAIRAVWKCNPVMNLPPEKYDAWGDMELNFDPSEMLF